MTPYSGRRKILPRPYSSNLITGEIFKLAQIEADDFCAAGPPNDLELCGGDGWVAYQHQKCYKLLPGVYANRAQAAAHCAAQSNNSCASILVEIRFQAEQSFLQKYLFETSGVTTNVWTGGQRYSAAIFRWPTGRTRIEPPRYENYLNGGPSSSERARCLAMLSGLARADITQQGKWTDQTCEAHNAVVCEKPQVTTLDGINERLGNYQQLSEAQFSLANYANALAQIANQRITTSQKNLVPSGFIYAQLNGQPSAETLWPGCTWQEVTGNYSAPTVQVDSSWTLWQRTAQNCTSDL